MPFLPTPSEKLKLEDYKETTYVDLETDTIKNEVIKLLFAVVFSIGASLKFNIHMSLVIQSGMGLVHFFDSIVFQKYIFGAQKSSTGGTLYGELLSPPTAADLAKVNEASADRNYFTPDEPRVEELPDEEPKQSTQPSEKSASKATTSASELD